jgi:hypothetical protein
VCNNFIENYGLPKIPYIDHRVRFALGSYWNGNGEDYLIIYSEMAQVSGYRIVMSNLYLFEEPT